MVPNPQWAFLFGSRRFPVRTYCCGVFHCYGLRRALSSASLGSLDRLRVGGFGRLFAHHPPGPFPFRCVCGSSSRIHYNPLYCFAAAVAPTLDSIEALDSVGFCWMLDGRSKWSRTNASSRRFARCSASLQSCEAHVRYFSRFEPNGFPWAEQLLAENRCGGCVISAALSLADLAGPGRGQS